MGFEPSQSRAWLSGGCAPPGGPSCALRSRYSGEVDSAPTLVLGSGSEQQPRAASSVRPLDAGCSSAMAALPFHQRRSQEDGKHPHASRPLCGVYSRRGEGAAGRAAADFQPIAPRRASWLSADWVPVSQRLRPRDSVPQDYSSQGALRLRGVRGETQKITPTGKRDFSILLVDLILCLMLKFRKHP